MKKNLIFFALILIFCACKKKNDNACIPVSVASESAAIADFCSYAGIDYSIDSNGIFYQIIDPGAGQTASLDSIITVTYTASLLNGQVIEDHSNNPVSLPLYQFIEGWRIAIPYIQKGGHIKMIIPSSLAYGCTGISGLVPPNSPLYYDLILIDVSN